MKRFIQTFLLILILTGIYHPITANAEGNNRLQAVKEIPVVVIDPGHGGENQGTLEGSVLEKDMNMITAMAMYDALRQYDGVEVYMTHTDDVDLSLKDRATFALDKKADFLFSIHYNASEEHALFGSELWVPSKSPANNYGYQFGVEYLKNMSEEGLFVRGIKTRLNDKGLDYYGIIRECANLGIPAVILEHCHVDESHDIGFCDTEEDMILLGQKDAQAVARYLGLSNKITGEDYSDYKLIDCDGNAPIASTLRDATEPEFCTLEFLDADYTETGILNAKITAKDSDSPLMYYDFSIDGGETYSARCVWPGSNTLTGEYDETFTLSIVIPSDSKPTVSVRAYNMYDLCTESNFYESPEIFLYGKEDTAADIILPEESIPVDIIETPDVVQSSGTLDSILFLLEILIVVLICAGILYFIAHRLVQASDTYAN